MKYLVILLFFSQVQLSWGQKASDAASEQALKQTQDLLRNKQQRGTYIKNNKGAKNADDNVKSLTGGNEANIKETYDIAADVFRLVAEKSKKPNGEMDVEKMNALMKEYQTNPEAFYRQMTPEQRKRIQELGKKIGPAPTSQK
ncbi:MAG: hypothetical protein H6625_05875 [Bdellovibrionaceae bacterium]|nr:hypothetical protein [Pseudobdellovibrionaceae bacterium]